MEHNQSHDPRIVRPRRWPMLAAGGLLALGVAVVGSQFSVRHALAQDGAKKSQEEIQNEIRKTLDSLKKGPDPVKEEEKPVELNPVDELRQANEAVKKAQKAVEENPKSEEVRKALEDATRKYQDLVKKNRPNLQFNPIAPINPEDLDQEIARFNGDLQRMMEEMQKQMRVMPFQPGFFPGNRMMIGGMGAPRHMLRMNGDMRLGVRLERPNATLIDQLDLGADQGLVVETVVPNSPAEKAGIKQHDILLEIGGKPVPSDSFELQRFMREFKPGAKVDVIVMRKGKKETLKEVTLPSARPEINQLQPQFAFPNFQNPQLPPVAFGGGGRLSTMSISINNGEFTIRCVEDQTTYTIVGSRENGKPKVTRIEVNDNGTVVKADSIDKLDAKYQPTVEKILKNVR